MMRKVKGRNFLIFVFLMLVKLLSYACSDKPVDRVDSEMHQPLACFDNPVHHSSVNF